MPRIPPGNSDLLKNKTYIDYETGEIVERPTADTPPQAPAPPRPPAVHPPVLADLTPGDPPPEADAALIRINPARDEKIIALSREIDVIAAYASRAQVTNPQEAKTASADLTAIASLKKAIEEKRREYKAPILECGREIDRVFELIAGPLNSADQTLRTKLLTYNQEIERQRQEAIELNRLKEELARRETAQAQANGEPPPAPPALVPVPDERTRYRSEIGIASITWVLDHDKVENAIRNQGVTEIPGLVIWFEPKWKVLNIKHVPEEYKKPTTRIVGRPGAP